MVGEKTVSLGVNLASLVTFTEEETRLCLEVDKNLVD